MTFVSRPSTTLSPKRSDPSWQRDRVLVRRCAPSGRSPSWTAPASPGSPRLCRGRPCRGVMMCGVGKLEFQQPPVPDQVPRGGRHGWPAPTSARPTVRKPGLTGIAQPRTAPALVQRCAPTSSSWPGKPTRASQLRTVTLTWASRNRNRKGTCVPAIHRAGVNGADHRCAWPVCGTTDSWVRGARRRMAGRRSTATRATAATRPMRGPIRCGWTGGVR